MSEHNVNRYMNKEKYPLISVILPTYNVANYLQQCLESVKAQTYSNIEVVIIIDGATDGSYEIAREFIKTDNRFIVYWQENEGSGPARNNGLAHSKGDFVMFIDPDDWIEPELIEKLVLAQQEKDYDLVASNKINLFYNSSGELKRKVINNYNEEELYTTKELIDAFPSMLTNGVIGAPTAKLFKNSIIRDCKVVFPPLRRTQDVVFNYRYYSNIKNIKFISYSGYNYRVEQVNNIGRTGQDYYKTIIYLYNDFIKLYKIWGHPFPEEQLCNYLFEHRINTNLQRCAYQHWNIRPIVENITIKEIVLNSTPKRLSLRILRYAILKKQIIFIYIYLSIIAKIKMSGVKKTRG